MAVVTGSSKVQMAFNIAKTQAGSSFSVSDGEGHTITFTNGTGANQIDTYFFDKRTLAGAATENLDLSGVLTDIFGASVVNARIKYFYMRNTSATETLTIGGAAANPAPLWFGDAATDKMTIPPLGRIELIAPGATGWPITAATADQLKVANSAGASTDYLIKLAGASA